MPIATVHSRALLGLEAPAVRVETHLSNGLPAFAIVGMPETAVRESKERVRSAILNAHLEFPQQRITVNLAPADLRKEGGRFDLPIALGILAASRQIPADALSRFEFIGELALDGQLRAVPGSLCAALACAAGGRQLVLPSAAAEHAALVDELVVLPAPSLLAVCAHLRGRALLSPQPSPSHRPVAAYPDLADVIGQATARRALEIAAAGAHHVLLCGPPGAGKTLLASRLPGILPPASALESREILAIHGLSTTTQHLLVPGQRPFRTPHHSASAAALVGGGSRPQAGEITLAHGGVLFLDELPEFARPALEALREPLENGWITIARARQRLRLPARFQLIAALNPCPCGYFGDDRQDCRCTPDQIQRYQHRLSGPLLDRMDLMLTVPRLPADVLLRPATTGESSRDVRARVTAARELALARQGCCNAQLAPESLLALCALSSADCNLLERAAQQLLLSARACHRVLRVARTIADLEGAGTVARAHLGEALALRLSPLHGRR